MRRGISVDGPAHLDVVRDAGFDTVRLPVAWSPHLAVRAPYGVDEAFFERVDRAVDAALGRDLAVVLDVHHFDELSADADRERPRFLALWSQIARRYAGVGRRLCFELLNEPHEPLTADRWNALVAEALAVVRASSPERPVIVGPARWNIVDALPTLRLPDDEHLVVTVHYYSPFGFTHQGAGWLVGAYGCLGTRWGSEAERARVRADLERAAAWARARGRPLFLGEFGAIVNARMADRAAWTALVRSEAERLGIAWAYWDLTTRLRGLRPWPRSLAGAAEGGSARHVTGAQSTRSVCSDVSRATIDPPLSRASRRYSTASAPTRKPSRTIGMPGG
jgi:endoglucanase